MSRGLLVLWTPVALLSLAGLGVAVFVYLGVSRVTGATITLKVARTESGPSYKSCRSVQFVRRNLSMPALLLSCCAEPKVCPAIVCADTPLLPLRMPSTKRPVPANATPVTTERVHRHASDLVPRAAVIEFVHGDVAGADAKLISRAAIVTD